MSLEKHPNNVTVCEDIDSTLAAPYAPLGISILNRMGYPLEALPPHIRERIDLFASQEQLVTLGRRRRMYEKGKGPYEGSTVILQEPGEVDPFRVPESGFLAAFQEALRDWELHETFPLLHHANSGTNLLVLESGFVHGGYYTARKDNEQGSMTKATQRWLDRHGFPNPENVTICKDVFHKVMMIMERHLVHEGMVDSSMNVVLVDDRSEELAQVLAQIRAGKGPLDSEALRQAAQRFTLVGFGQTDQDTLPLERHYGIPILPLPDWEESSVRVLVTTLGDRLA